MLLPHIVRAGWRELIVTFKEECAQIMQLPQTP